MERLPHWKVMEKYDLEMLEKLEPWRQHLFEQGVLPRKTKEMLTMAMAVQARFLPGVKIHAGLAMDHGATPEEVFEVCALSLLIGGVPAYRDSVLTIEELIEERGL